MIRSLFFCLLLVGYSWADTNFFNDIQLKSAKISSLSTSILFEIQDAEENQVAAFAIYTQDYGKYFGEFSDILKQSTQTLEKLRDNYNDETLKALKGQIGRMEAIIQNLRKTNMKIRGLIYGES